MTLRKRRSRLSPHQRKLLRMITAAEKRVNPLYHAAHAAMLAFHGLSGFMCGLRWDPDAKPLPPFPPLPTLSMTDEQAREVFQQGPKAADMIRRGDVAWWVWPAWKKYGESSAALSIYVNGEDVFSELRAAVRRSPR